MGHEGARDAKSGAKKEFLAFCLADSFDPFVSFAPFVVKCPTTDDPIALWSLP